MFFTWYMQFLGKGFGIESWDLLNQIMQSKPPFLKLFIKITVYSVNLSFMWPWKKINALVRCLSEKEENNIISGFSFENPSKVNFVLIAGLF